MAAQSVVLSSSCTSMDLPFSSYPVRGSDFPLTVPSLLKYIGRFGRAVGPKPAEEGIASAAISSVGVRSDVEGAVSLVAPWGSEVRCFIGVLTPESTVARGREGGNGATSRPSLFSVVSGEPIGNEEGL